ncbi:hypothetical protein LXL04_014363 [Taraxacum kok-saghyz]
MPTHTASPLSFVVFLWGGVADTKKISWASWDKVTAPKNSGGLGLGSLKAFNISLIAKWWWRLRNNKEAIWCKVITGIHNLNNKPSHQMSDKSIIGVWKNIAGIKEDLEKVGVNMEEVFKKEVRSCRETIVRRISHIQHLNLVHRLRRDLEHPDEIPFKKCFKLFKYTRENFWVLRFWLDKWNGDSTLKEAFPQLYRLEKKKHCKIGDRIKTTQIQWEWRSSTAAETLTQDINILSTRIGNFRPSIGEDGWICNLAEDGNFRVRDLRQAIDTTQLGASMEDIINWTHDVPIKVSCFIWRANLGRILTSCALMKRGIQIYSLICSFCNNAEEDEMNVLWNCPFAVMIWEWVLKWCGMQKPTANSISDVLKAMDQVDGSAKKRKDMTAICYGTMWMIWKARCDWIFKKRRHSPTKVADEVKTIVYTWLKHRRSKCHYSWINWCIDPEAQRKKRCRLVDGRESKRTKGSPGIDKAGVGTRK